MYLKQSYIEHHALGLFSKSLPSFGMKLKRSINIIIFACQHKNMSIE